MITVQCTEPQTIYDLMRKHGLRCSDVWNSAVCLSARSPCTALTDHMMNIVFVNKISVGSSFNSPSDISTFYHNMKHIKVRARREALRYKPYIRHFHSSGGAASLKENRPTEDLITVALYYEDTMSKLSSVIEADGRFVSSHAIEGHCGEYVVELEQDNNVILTGPTRAEGERDSETEENDHPFVCFCCNQISDYALPCGHLCCQTCLVTLQKPDITCGVCRAKSLQHYVIKETPELDPECQACGKVKHWLAGCGHVTCTCNSNRCLVCNRPITVLRRLFLSTYQM
ncbi:hypothetical protein D5F01_LYC13339 [Larimichthys crocea]|uniref:RING-type domain-containing protein n=2 Tax=Larimichthys crocea TaxID=215358 RepID=A0A6G0I7P0_LARCR|nr:hypothetical protein D5F01_LYC13339 [Larimichthys crocea]